MSEAQIRSLAWITDHDIDLLSAVLGQASLVGRFVLYARGPEGAFCTWPLEGLTSSSYQELMSVAKVAQELGVSRLHVWGPSSGPYWHGFRQDRWYVSPVRNYDCDMRLNSAESRNRWERFNSPPAGMRSAGDFQVNDSLDAKWELERLVAVYMRREDIPWVQRQLIGQILTPVPYKDVLFFTALLCRRALGVVAVLITQTGIGIVRWALSDRTPHGVSDHLYYIAFSHLWGLGISEVDLGYGGSPGLFAYKEKLGAAPYLGPVVRAGFVFR